MREKFFVASCVFTKSYPALSRKVQNYVRKRFNLPISHFAEIAALIKNRSAQS